MTTNDQGFILNRHGGFSDQARLTNTINALRLLALPLSVAIYDNGKRLYFLDAKPLGETDKRAIIGQVQERFGLVTTLRCLGEALKAFAPAMPPEQLVAWRVANKDAQRERNNVRERDKRLALDPGLAERRIRRARPLDGAAERPVDREQHLEDAAERMAEAARLRAEKAAMRTAKPVVTTTALSRTDWLHSLRWNRRNLIQDLLAKTAGASPEHSLTFARFLVGAARRGLEPGAPAFGIALRGVSELESIAALEALTSPWLGLSLSPEAQPNQLRAEVSDKLIIHASASDRRSVETFALLAARTEDFIGDESRPIRRTFALAITLRDDESAPQGFHEIRVTGFDPSALRDARDQAFAEAKECALAAMNNSNPNMRVRERMNAYRASLYE